MKNILLLFIAFALIQVNITKAQDNNYRNKNYKSDYFLNYLNENEFEDLRSNKSGTKAYAFMFLLPFDDFLPSIFLDGDSTIAEGDFDNRLAETFFPNFRYYLSESSCVTFGIVFARKTSSGEGEIDTTLSSVPILTDLYKAKRSKVALRIAYDRHFKVFRRKWFDIDPYYGISLNTGISPVKVISEQTYPANDYFKQTTSSNYFTMGGDFYLGTNIRFERFSIGAEVLMLGLDYQKGFGKSKIEYDSQIGGTAESGTYYTSDSWNSLYAFSKLNLSSSSSSMYRGLRLSFVYYIM